MPDTKKPQDRIRWILDGEIAGARTLNRPIIDHEADAFGHPKLQELFEDHLNDPNAHNLAQKITELIEEHNNDPLAHRNLWKKFIDWLKDHELDPEAHNVIKQTILDKLRTKLNNHSHPEIENKLRKYHVGINPPEKTSTGEVFFDENTQELKILINGKWIPFKNSFKKTINKFVDIYVSCHAVDVDGKSILKNGAHVPFFYFISNILNATLEIYRKLPTETDFTLIKNYSNLETINDITVADYSLIKENLLPEDIVTYKVQITSESLVKEFNSIEFKIK